VGDLKDVGELTGKSVKELREICKAKGIDASTCTDKGDLVDLITSKEDEESRESGVGELGSSLSVESQQTSSVVTESDVLEKNLAMEARDLLQGNGWQLEPSVNAHPNEDAHSEDRLASINMNEMLDIEDEQLKTSKITFGLLRMSKITLPDIEDEQDHFREQAGASGKRDRISRILRYIEDGAGNNTHSQHKRHVIALGLTGSGKSTSINSLAGCKLRRVTEEEADKFELSRDALVVASGGERGGRKEATKIGNRFGKSQTEVLQAVAVDENDDDAVATFFLILIMSKTVFLESKLG
jgi:ribose 5-phosphate isomerase RpiB